MKCSDRENKRTKEKRENPGKLIKKVQEEAKKKEEERKRLEEEKRKEKEDEKKRQMQVGDFRFLFMKKNKYNFFPS